MASDICLHFSLKKSSKRTAVIEFIPLDVVDRVDENRAARKSPGSPGIMAKFILKGYKIKQL